MSSTHRLTYLQSRSLIYKLPPTLSLSDLGVLYLLKVAKSVAWTSRAVWSSVTNLNIHMGKGSRSHGGILGNNHILIGWQIIWVNEPAIVDLLGSWTCHCSFSDQKALSWFVATPIFASWSHLPRTLLWCLSRLRSSGACLNPDPTPLLPCHDLTCNNALSLTLKFAPCSYESTRQLNAGKMSKKCKLLAISEL